jgi:translocation and assembly module TamA
MDNAMQRLTILQRHLGQSPTSKQLLGLYAKAPNTIAAALQPFGYFDATIKANLIKKQNHWFAHYEVTAGPRITIKNSQLIISGSGANTPPFNTITHQFPMLPNTPLNTQDYTNTKDSLIETAINHGYLTSHFITNTLEINTQNLTSNITLAFDTGPRYTFGKTTFSPTPLAPSFLERYVEYPYGSPFSNDTLRDLQDKLGNSQYFKQVIVSPQLASTSDKNTSVPIEVKLIPKNRNNYKLSIGYGTNNGIRSSIQLDQPFITPQGHQLRSSLTLSKQIALSDANQDKITVDTDYPTAAALQVKYIIPGAKPSKEIFTMEAAMNRSSFYTDAGRRPFTNQNITGQYINNLHSWKQITSLTALHESSKTEPLPSKEFDLISPSIQWTKLNTNSLLFPTKGSSLNFILRAADNLADSHYNFLIIRAKARKLLTFSLKNRAVFHSELGYMTLKDQNNVPKTYQLLTGGATTLRGFDYMAIGPGTHMGIASMELQRMLENNWLLGAFIEAGNVYRNFEAITNPTTIDDKTKRSNGLSLHKQTPIGSFNLSYARAKHWVSEEERWKWKWKWHFSIGTEL